MPLLHIFVILCFLFSSQTEQFQRTELLLWQELASIMMKHQINFVSRPNLIFPEIQYPSSNAFLKLHCRLHLRARKTRWPWFSHNGMLHCLSYRLENSRDHQLHHIPVDVTKFTLCSMALLTISTWKYPLIQKKNNCNLWFTVLILYTLQLLTLG